MIRPGFRTFKRSCLDWESFVTARKYAGPTFNTEDEARAYCRRWNANRSKYQIRHGTKEEFTLVGGVL